MLGMMRKPFAQAWISGTVQCIAAKKCQRIGLALTGPHWHCQPPAFACWLLVAQYLLGADTTSAFLLNLSHYVTLGILSRRFKFHCVQCSDVQQKTSVQTLNWLNSFATCWAFAFAEPGESCFKTGEGRPEENKDLRCFTVAFKV